MHGFQDIKVIDLTFDEDLAQLRVLNKADKGGIYCISFTSAYRSMTRQIAKMIKDADPMATLIAGGPHPTIMPEDTLEIPGVDIVVSGEGDYILPDVVKTVCYGGNLAEIKSIWFKKDGRIIKASEEAAKPIVNLDDLPFPSQEGFPVEEYFRRKGFRELCVIAGRGCPMQCTFCKPTLDKIFGKRLRFRSAVSIVDEIEMIIKKYNLDSFFFADDTFTMDENRTIEICNEMIKRKIHTFWRCLSTVKLKKETTQLMRKAGCLSVSFGVESGSPEILRNIKKNVAIEDTIKTFKLCKESGMITWAFLMVGNVGETRHTVEMTKELVKKIRPFGCSVAVTTPIPGTELYEYAKSKNMLTSDEDMDFDYLFSDSYQNMLRLPDLTRDEVLSLKRDLEKTAAESMERWRDLLKIACNYLTIKRVILRMIKNPLFLKILFVFLVRSTTIKYLNILNPMAGKKREKN
jgi:radical SAM superfamily enzyme YgiQ (UPF0313 family)